MKSIEQDIADQRRWDLKRRTDPEARIKWLAKKKRYRQRHAEKIRASNLEYMRRNPEKMDEWRKRWSVNNPGTRRLGRLRQRVRHPNAIPVWSDFAAINQIYARCERVNACTGMNFQIDHVIPLRGKKVSGLHVPWNLQLIPAWQNLRKHNKVLSS